MAETGMNEAIEKVLSYGLQGSYDAIETKDPLMLYFCTDSRKIYKGDQDYTDFVRFVTERPTTPARGVLYFVETTATVPSEEAEEGTVTVTTTTVEAWTGSAWKTIVPAFTDEISDNDGDYADGAPVKIPTAEAVRNYVTRVAGDAIQIEAGTQDATINIIRGGEGTPIQLNGVATKPEYDPTTRKFTFPVTGGEALVVELGKDIFLDGSKNNGYNKETKKLELYLNDDAGTKLEIPVDDLIDIEEIAEVTNRVTALENAHGWGTF